MNRLMQVEAARELGVMVLENENGSILLLMKN